MPGTDHGIPKCFRQRITVLASGGSRKGETPKDWGQLRSPGPQAGRLWEDRPECWLPPPDAPRRSQSIRCWRSAAKGRAPPDSRVRTSFPSRGPRLGLASPSQASLRPAPPRPARRARRPKGRGSGRAPSQPRSQPAPRGPTRTSPVTHLCRANSSQLFPSRTLIPTRDGGGDGGGGRRLRLLG